MFAQTIIKEMIDITHLSSYDSFRTKKSIEKKQRIKEKYSNIITADDFIISHSPSYGIVIEVKYNNAFVLLDNKIILARLRSDLNATCNQILFPGDKVVVSSEQIITNLIKRTSLLSRTKKDSTRAKDIGTTKNIAANVDIAVIVVSAKEPPLHPKFIDRYLMILENSNIPAIICLNKSDQKTAEEEKILDVYRRLDIPVIETSTYNNIGIDLLKKYLNGKQAIFIGNSGVGKSSLTNALMDYDDIKTGNIGNKSKRGKHTTTSSKYYIWNSTSSIIDTPGIRSLDISNFNPCEIQYYFKEFTSWKEKCKYNNCLHYHESLEDCMVKKAINSGLINRDRYESYLRIMSDLLGDKDYINILREVISNYE